MESRLERLKSLKNEANLQIKGLDNYPKDATVMMFVNHTGLLDIFYLPMCLPEDIVSAVSARLMYKKDINRQQTFEKYLNTMPIEAHGTSFYREACLNAASTILSKEISMSIFPEGVYILGKDKIYRGRTGGTRILFKALLSNPNIALVPVAINYPKGLSDVDNYSDFSNDVAISILEPVVYQKYFETFMNADDYDTRNHCLHQVTDLAMASIAKELGQDYTSEYFGLDPKQMILPDGRLISDSESINPNVQAEYQKILGERAKTLIKRFNK